MLSMCSRLPGFFAYVIGHEISNIQDEVQLHTGNAAGPVILQDDVTWPWL